METIFQLSSLLVMPFWLLIIFLPHWQWTRRIMASPWVVAPAALLYTLLVVPSLVNLLPQLANPQLGAIGALLGTPAGATIANRSGSVRANTSFLGTLSGASPLTLGAQSASANLTATTFELLGATAATSGEAGAAYGFSREVSGSLGTLALTPEGSVTLDGGPRRWVGLELFSVGEALATSGDQWAILRLNCLILGSGTATFAVNKVSGRMSLTASGTHYGVIRLTVAEKSGTPQNLIDFAFQASGGAATVVRSTNTLGLSLPSVGSSAAFDIAVPTTFSGSFTPFSAGILPLKVFNVISTGIANFTPEQCISVFSNEVCNQL